MAIQQTYYLCRNHPNYPKGITERNKKINGRKKSNWITCKEEGGNVHLNLYVVKTKSTEIRNVLLLHTTEAARYVTNDEKKKPYTNKIYDSAKGGVDIPDQRMVSLTCKEKKRKWTLVALVYVPDMSNSQQIWVNSQAIHAMNTRDTSTKSFKFGWELMISLSKPHMSNRITIEGLSSNP